VRTWLAIILAVAALTAVGPTGWNPAQTNASGQSLSTLVFQYLDTADAEEAQRLLDAIQRHPDASVERVSRIIETERPYGDRPIGTLADEQILIGGRSYALALSVPLTYQPSRGYALVLCLHGAGFTGNVYLERWQARLGEEYLLACPTYPGGAWFTRRAEELVLATVQYVRQRYHIDPDRIFLTGMSNGGIGAWLIGMHHASLFAGIAPMAGGLDDVLMPFLANLRNTPVYMIHGAKDQVMPAALSRSISRELTALGYPHVYREHQGEHPMAGGHYFPREELPALVTWFSRQRRDPLPARVTLIREASHFHPFGWVRLDATDPIAAFSDDLVDKHDQQIKARTYAKLEAAVVAPNRIEVKTERIQRYSLFLNDRLIDPAKPVSIWTNGQLSHEGSVSLSVETLLRQARVRQDPRHLFPIQLAIMVPKQPS
jgi:pimeloyl-ACP methyl ester carboxylesterase